jgi:hypothetical protein
MVWAVGHPGKDASKGWRGWSGGPGACDTVLEVNRSGDDRSVTVMKLKDGQDGEEIGFRLKVHELGLNAKGKPISSCTVELSGKGRAVARLKLRPVQAAVVRVVKALTALGGDAPTEEQAIAAAIDQLPADPSQRDKRRYRVREALEKLAGEYLRLEGGRVFLV